MHSFDRTMLASLAFADPDKGDPTHDLACQYLAIPENQLTLGRRFSKDRLYCHAEREEYFAHLKASTDPDNLFTKTREAMAHAELEAGRPILEFVISKGEGKYKTTVGFIDLRLKYAARVGKKFWRKEKEATFTFTDDPYYEENLETAGELGLDYGEFLVAAAAAPFHTHSGSSDRVRTLSGRRYEAERALEVHQAYTRFRRDYVSFDWSWSTLNVEVKSNPVPIGNVLRQIKLYAEYVEGKWLLATTYPLAASDVSALNSCNIGHVALGDRFAAWVAERRVNDQVEVASSTFVL